MPLEGSGCHHPSGLCFCLEHIFFCSLYAYDKSLDRVGRFGDLLAPAVSLLVQRGVVIHRSAFFALNQTLAAKGLLGHLARPLGTLPFRVEVWFSFC